MNRPVRPLAERLMERVEIDPVTGCWNFRGAISESGYGVIGIGRRADGTLQTHRVSYRLFVGPIPQGLHIDHLCRNRVCCNPDHLEAVTQAENNLRSWQARGPKTHCKRGHEFTPENTGIQGHGRTGRRCVTCNRASARDSYQRRKATA